jgi:hypothetical protein
MDIRETVYWIHVSEEKVKWLAHVNMVMNPSVPHKVKNF